MKQTCSLFDFHSFGFGLVTRTSCGLLAERWRPCQHRLGQDGDAKHWHGSADETAMTIQPIPRTSTSAAPRAGQPEPGLPLCCFVCGVLNAPWGIRTRIRIWQGSPVFSHTRRADRRGLPTAHWRGSRQSLCARLLHARGIWADGFKLGMLITHGVYTKPSLTMAAVMRRGSGWAHQWWPLQDRVK